MTDQQVQMIVEAIRGINNLSASVVGLMFVLIGLWIPTMVALGRIARALEKEGQ